MTISDLLAAHHAWFTALAQIWLDSGAAAFGVWSEDTDLALAQHVQRSLIPRDLPRIPGSGSFPAAQPSRWFKLCSGR